jgi:GTPase SAR1 family protein
LTFWVKNISNANTRADTAGQEEYQHMLDRYMKEGQGFICVYSITDPVSFSQVQKFKDKVWAVKDRGGNDSVPFIVNLIVFLT